MPTVQTSAIEAFYGRRGSGPPLLLVHDGRVATPS